jgi:hypothetical protein
LFEHWDDRLIGVLIYLFFRAWGNHPIGALALFILYACGDHVIGALVYGVFGVIYGVSHDFLAGDFP